MNIVLLERCRKDIKKLGKKYRSINADISDLLKSLQSDPTQGTALGRDCYKIRLKITSKSRGKSGGARVITCVKVVGETIYLLTIYDKSETESLTDGELAGLLDETGTD